MAERSFKVEIRNVGSSISLVQSFNHLCGGSWTAGLAPQGTIPPRSSGTLQSESDGVLTGTEGYVKYDIARAGSKVGMIYVYWDNPWWGVTHFRCGAALEDILPDCDFDPPPGSSGFTGGSLTQAALHFDSYASGEAGGGEITSLTDFSNAVLLGPFFAFALLGIDKTLRCFSMSLSWVRSPPARVYRCSALHLLALEASGCSPRHRWSNGSGSGRKAESRSGSIASILCSYRHASRIVRQRRRSS